MKLQSWLEISPELFTNPEVICLELEFRYFPLHLETHSKKEEIN